MAIRLGFIYAIKPTHIVSGNHMMRLLSSPSLAINRHDAATKKMLQVSVIKTGE